MNDDLPHPAKCRSENLVCMPIVFDSPVENNLTVAQWRQLFDKFNRHHPNIKRAHCHSISWNGKEEIDI